jgi:hypothetical protein
VIVTRERERKSFFEDEEQVRGGLGGIVRIADLGYWILPSKKI